MTKARTSFEVSGIREIPGTNRQHRLALSELVRNFARARNEMLPALVSANGSVMSSG